MSSLATRFYNKFVNQRNILRNLTYSKIRELEINSKFGRFTNNGTYCVLTGKFTGRSPNDKYIIDDAETRDKVWWGNINHPISNTKFNTLLKDVEKHYETLDNIYIYDGFCGADNKTRKKVRFFTENCWQHHFVKNMFIEPQKDELINFEPDFTLINACSIVDKKYKEDKMNSENFVMLNVSESLGIIGGTAYTGEMKKGIFSLMHYWLPQKGILTMHCSANKGFNGDTALFFGLSGTGKCNGKNTPILMYDGTIKMVQDIKEEELLMGIDSKPRKVLGLGRGEDEMYEISNIKGDIYTANSEHILCLKHNRTPYIRDRKDRSSYMLQWFNINTYKTNTLTMSYKNQNKETVYEELEKLLEEKKKLSKYFTITVKDYLKVSKGYLKNFVGYKVGVEFPEKEVDLEPYALGYWLGDGTSAQAQITTQEEVVVEYFQKYIKQLGGYVHQGKDSATTRHSLHYSFRKCEFKNSLRKYNILGNKHIPHIYKCNSRENRLKLLAGLIDSDGYYDKKGKCYEITQKNSKLSEDIVYLCRSLGFACYSKKCKKSCMYKGEKREGEYNRMHISGNGLEEIPVLCIRKEAEVRTQIKDALCSQISVKSIGRDKYYGFELDGNHKYLLGNFIVTHNTTLSADPDRLLIGDDEHGWSDDGIFNLEGGCYAKTIKLTEENEPDIFRAIRPNALLENISFKEGSNEPDYDDISITQNGRVSYPIDHIDNIEPTMTGTHPKSIVFLTCDALGVLPIVSKLTKEQAMYHFLSGYTSKVAGTEIGIKEPIATFSAGYGEAFLTLPPIRYAELLKEKMEKHNANVYLVNTGWVKGKYSIGERVKLSISRKCISAILDETIDNNGYTNNNLFNLSIPNKIDGIDENLMNPMDSWEDKEDYIKVATDLKQKFEQNLKDKNIVL